MNLRQKYTEETGKDAIRLPYQSICYVTIEYVEWLEQQLRQYNVSGQSELLLAFVEHIKKDNELTETVNVNDVEAFIKSQR